MVITGDSPTDISSRLIYMGALLAVLRRFGGSARSSDVYECLKSDGVARPADVALIQKSGETRFIKEVRFARKELVDAGLLTCPASGIWALSSRGWATDLSPEAARELVRLRRHGHAKPAVSVVSGRGLPTRGPKPSSWSGTVTRSSAGPTWAYVFRFGQTNVWKVGFAGDVDKRLADVNAHIPHEVIGTLWKAQYRACLANAPDAYGMEQNLLLLLSPYRTIGERAVCSEEVISAAWREAARSAP